MAKENSKNQKVKKAQAFLLSAAFLAGAFAPGGSVLGAAPGTAQLSPEFRIVVDGTEQTFYNASGSEVHPLVYQGSTYLPLRAIGELMGKNVNWDQATQTVSLSGTRTTAATAGSPDRAAKSQSVSIQVCPEFTIMVDGVKRSFTDAGGNAAYPLLYQGSTYLPLRAIGELMGKEVGWDGKTKTATLSGASAGLQVTDADSFGGTETAAGGIISVETAKEKALAHAGVSAGQAAFTKQKLEREDGRQVYEVEFYAGNAEYEYEIDAVTGDVLDFDYDAKHNMSGKGSPSASAIGEARAREIALAKVPGATAANVTKLKLDTDDGQTVYEVEIIYGNREYEFDVDAFSGTILKWDSEYHR